MDIKTSFQPTKKMIKAAEAVFMAMAFTQTIRPIVEAYQREILSRHKWENNEEFAKYGRRGVKKRSILEPKDAWLLDDADFQTYLKESNEARKKANLHVENEECCPLLVAEDLERQTKIVLANVMEPVTKISYNDLTGTVNTYDKYFDLTLRLLAPFVGSAADLLNKS